MQRRYLGHSKHLLTETPSCVLVKNKTKHYTLICYLSLSFSEILTTALNFASKVFNKYLVTLYLYFAHRAKRAFISRVHFAG